MITTVVFDLDDTLYDEIEYCRSGLAYISDILSSLPDAPCAEIVFDALWDEFTAGNHSRTFNAVLDKFGVDYNDSLISELIKIYRNHKPQITLPRDSRDVLALLKDKYTLALLTDGFLPTQELKVKALKIEDYFKTIVYTEELGREFWKPSPAGFEKIAQTLDAEPATMAYVADNELKDFIAPNNLGFVTIQLIRPARIHTETSDDPDAKAHHVIRQITDLPALLEKL